MEALRRKGTPAGSRSLGDEPHRRTTGRRCPSRSSPAPGSRAAPQLRTAGVLSALDAEFVLGDPAVALDPRDPHRAHGVRARPARRRDRDRHRRAARALPGQGDLAGVHVLRTLDDALALRTDCSAGSRLVVVGEGVLGSEIAATARHIGPGGDPRRPASRRRWPSRWARWSSALLAELHTERGVRLRLGTGVVGLTRRQGPGHRRRVEHGRGAAGRRGGGRDRRDPGHGVAGRQRARTRQRRGVRLPLPGRRRGSTPSVTWPAGTTSSSAGWSGWRTAPTPPSRPWRSPGRSSARTGPTRRCRTSGPTSSTPSSRCTASCRPTPKSTSSRATSRPAGSSRGTAAAAGSPASSAGTCPSRPACAVRRSSTRSPPPSAR